MAEQNTLYIAMLTDVGAAQQAKAIASGTPWNITHMGVGDGNGVTPIPSKLQKNLINENVRLKLNRLTVRADRPVLVAELILPPDVGGWWVREVGRAQPQGFAGQDVGAWQYQALLARQQLQLLGQAHYVRRRVGERGGACRTRVSLGRPRGRARAPDLR